MLFISIIVLLFTTVCGSSFENNETNIGVFVNHLSSCNFNHDTGNVMCINQDYNTVIQYHDVNQIAMCPYHYCILFEGKQEYSCTGYILTLIGGTMDKHLNPLSPDMSYVGFTGNPEDDHVSVGYTFLGYNILIDYFEQNVDNVSNKIIKSISCMEPYSTHIVYEDGTSDMFGAHEVIFRNIIQSLVIGSVIHTCIAFSLYIISLSLCKCLNGIIVNMAFIPFVTFLSCYLILFVAEDFVVKVFPFTISSIIGIMMGYIMASSVYNVIQYAKNRNKSSTVDTEEESTQFVITEETDSDDGNTITEIELSKVERV